MNNYFVSTEPETFHVFTEISNLLTPVLLSRNSSRHTKQFKDLSFFPLMWALRFKNTLTYPLGILLHPRRGFTRKPCSYDYLWVIIVPKCYKSVTKKVLTRLSRLTAGVV
ncbi:hypothetical protein AMJ52_01200 [candidate division TA06 bacterium DG_78]|uniref:Uncharacterized protein n=1 Tax=candidate division TA06 bacterium DG_78 TaxID=1703772 RepID=A0A0S7YHN5_UNCT6|nr:MAG: hypothetical protein AMJ52_01200 [candidate division TA06 bacterium DG_78]